MGGLLTTKEDMLVLDSGTPGSVRELIRQVADQGLERVCCVRPASQRQEELRPWLREVQQAATWTKAELYSGLLVEVADEQGRIDLSVEPQEVDFLLLSTRRLVLGSQTYNSRQANDLTADGPFCPLHLLQLSLIATARAMKRYRNVILADLFCNLETLGIAEGNLSDELLDLLIESTEVSGSALLINERHRCPSLSIVQRFFTAQVPIFLGSGSPWAAARGRYRYADQLLRSLPQDR